MWEACARFNALGAFFNSLGKKQAELKMSRILEFLERTGRFEENYVVNLKLVVDENVLRMRKLDNR